MATVYPRANYRPVVGIANDPRITPIGTILHVDGGGSKSLYGYFNGPSAGIESHLHIPRVVGPREVEQYRDLDHEADANYKGNSWISGGKRLGFHSVETQGTAEGLWTPDQIYEIKAFLKWDHERYDYPLRVAPGYRSPGVGFHIMFQPIGPGTASWSNAKGKQCPGPDRIRQFHTVIVPWMERGGRDLATAPTPKPPEEDIMASIDDLRAAIRAEVPRLVAAEVEKVRVKQYTDLKNYMATWVGLYGKNIPVPADVGVKDPKVSGLTALNWLMAWAVRTKADTIAIRAQMDALAAGLKLSPEQMQAIADAGAKAGAAEMAKLTRDAVIVQGDVTVTPSAKPEA